MIPTSARRRFVIKMLIDYSTGWVTPRRRFEKKTTSQSSAEAPSYTMGAVGLSTGPLPHQLMETIQKGKQTNKQTNNMCANNKGKQTNKQTSVGGMCAGVDAGGGAELHSMWSPICNVSEYMEELRRCFGKAQSLMHRVVL